MKYFFDHRSNLKTRNFKKLLKNNKVFIKSVSQILNKEKFDSKNSFQQILEKLIKSASTNFKTKSNNLPIFSKEITPIENQKPLTEKTLWGGVSLKNVDVAKNFIRKLLVIRKQGILGFEIHKYKLEKLKVLEGACLVLFSNHQSPNWQKGKVTVKLASVGDKFTFLPGDEHGIIALTNCVIEETSTNHLDDLTYIFKASQI